MNKITLLKALYNRHPGWSEWDLLIYHVESLHFKTVQLEYLGTFLTAGKQLCFADASEIQWPVWLPGYVKTIYGMKADDPEMAGGYAHCFHGTPAEKGAVFYVNTKLQILAPDADRGCFIVIDTLEEFTRKNIRQVLAGKSWFELYQDLSGTMMD